MIILDVNLPDGNGFDFCKWVKANKKCIVLLNKCDLSQKNEKTINYMSKLNKTVIKASMK